MKSVMKHTFSMVPKAEGQRSTFDRSSGHTTTFDAGKLIPIFSDEVLPGDTFNLRATLFCRLNTPIVPFMDNLHLETQWFFVPNRLVWDNWKYFMGEKVNPGDTTEYSVPLMTVPAGGFTKGTIADFFGMPVGDGGLGMTGTDTEVISLYFRAFNLIYNEYYRDENLIDSLVVDKGDGPDDYDDYKTPPKRCKRPDYFTSALPWPQKGDAIELPLGDTAPVIGDGKVINFTDKTYDELQIYNATTNVMHLQRGQSTANVDTTASGSTPTQIDKLLGITETVGKSGMIVDLSAATAATINSLREAFQLQRMLERDARGGTRYTEIIRSHFLVTSPDARLQRPEILATSSARMSINPVQQTAPSSTLTPMGYLAAYGQCADSTPHFIKSFTEHGMIIGIASVRADIRYQQQLERRFSRQTKYDYYWPALAHLGEQEVLKKEIYATGSSANDEEVFGYQERYAEYRYKTSIITGLMRSYVSGTLDVWHLAEEPYDCDLNQSFIEDATHDSIQRVVATPEEPDFYMDMYFDLKCTRPMPVYSVPGLIDHF